MYFFFMRIPSLILCTALFLFSCQDNSKVIDQVKSEQEEPYFKPDFDYVQQTPDSLWTPEQKELVKKLQAVIMPENLKVVDNEIVFNMTKEEFVAMGIPEEYYELIEKDMVNNNKFFKENNVDVDSMMKESYKK